jgi:hypothetical protein
LDVIDGLLKIDRKKRPGEEALPQELIDIEKKGRETKEKVGQTGFIAQDVEEAAKSANYDFSVDVDETGIYGLRYAEFVVPLVKAVQELSEQNDRLQVQMQAQNDQMQAQIDELTERLSGLLGEGSESGALRSKNAVEPSPGLQDAAYSGTSLQQNIPNPFHQSTVIRYTLPPTGQYARGLAGTFPRRGSMFGASFEMNPLHPNKNNQVISIMLFRKFFIALSIGVFLCSTSRIKAAVTINEIMPSNTSYISPTWNFSGWIELYNNGAQAVSVSGWYLSDDADNPRKFRMPNHSSFTVPANGYIVVWCERNDEDLNGLQTNFKLDCEGGSLSLSDNSGNSVSTVSFPGQIKGASYARTVDGGGAWQHCATPSPGKTNSGSVFTDVRCPEPVFDAPGGIYSGSKTVRANIPAGMTLRYTTDGSEPAEDSPASSTGTFSITQTTVLRTRLFAAGRIPGPTVTHSYFIENREYNLPVVSITTNPKYLNDNTIGIYVEGTNGKPGVNMPYPKNWNRDWARPANIEYFSPDGEKLFEQECDISINGGASRNHIEKSIDLSAEKKYEGKNRFNYPFFPSKPNIRLKHVLLRNSGTDGSSYQTMMGDAFIQSIMIRTTMDVECQAYQPVIHYINGEYYGVINMRERNNKQYADENYGYDDTEIDLFEIAPNGIGYSQLNGTDAAFRQLQSLADGAPAAANYEKLKALLDIDACIDYLAAQFYINNWDWPQNNIKGFRKTKDGKFRFVIYDLDLTFGLFGSAGENSFTDTFNEWGGGDSEMGILIQNLFKYPDFKKQFSERFCLLAGSIFAPARVEHILDSIAGKVRTEVTTYHSQRWGNYAFDANINRMRTFAQQRPAYAISHLRSFMGLGAPQNLSLSSNHPAATIRVNGQPVPLGKFEGRVFSPVTVKATAPSGYKFSKWETLTSGRTVILPYAASSWSYYDEGSLDGTGWHASNDHASWKSGQAPLGYGNHDFNTTVSYGSNPNSKNPAAYFRRSFQLDKAPASGDDFRLDLAIDDGAVIYINGTEAARYQMPGGTVTYQTYATQYAYSNPDQTSISLPSSLFRQGNNVIAIEVHQDRPESSDIYLDAQLSCMDVSDAQAYSNAPEIQLPSSGSFNLRAVFIEDPGKSVPVRINEVSADNSIYVNEYFKRDDWIELYNTTRSTVDIAGMYLSDSKARPTKYQFPAGRPDLTQIPAYGYKIVWCDDLAAESQLHATFKLASEGGVVLLTASNLQWSDSLYYAGHGGDVSVGRYPDGADSVYLFNRPSIAASNFYSSYNKAVSQTGGLPTGTEDPSQIHPSQTATNSARIYPNPANDYVIIDAPEGYRRISFSLYAIDGRKVISVSCLPGENRINTGDFPSGLYIGVVNMDGKTEVTKIIKLR